jgi:nucleotide-binding universal stress UspA family protein
MGTPKRVLVAVDTSGHALNAVRYVACQSLHSDLEVRLFSILSLGDEEVFWGVMMDEEFMRRMKERYRLYARNCGQEAEKFLEQCRKILVGGGLPESRIDVSVRQRQKGIARDIIEEARKGYDAVVVGRRGLGRVESILLGSVSNKVVQKLEEVPVWVIGGDVHAQKVILAVDRSERSRKAVNYAAPFLADSGAEVTLCHVVRAFLPTFGPDFIGSDGAMEEKLLDRLKEDVGRMFDSYRNFLEGAGVRPEKISTVCKMGSYSRAADLLNTAREGGYGTIVMGRRGISVVREFLMGRVTTKVLNGAEGLAVWVVP